MTWRILAVCRPRAARSADTDGLFSTGTLAKAAAVLKENGAKSVLALVTHGILSGNAIETLNGSVLEALVVTNTVPLGDKVERVCGCDSECLMELTIGSAPSSA